MFENKFNTKKTDPLVEAVMKAQQDGEMRRQAIAHVNEAFGVYNRNAVIRENLAAYDAAIEESYKCMKEGKPLSPKQQKMEEKKDCYEGNDGNLANNYPPYDKVTRGDVIAGRLGKDQMGGKKKVMEKKSCYEEGAMDSDVVGGGAVTKDNKSVVSSTAPKADTSGPSASEKSALASKIKAMNEERKRTASVADAFMKGQKANQRTLRTDGKSVTYHGNTIAKHEGDEVHVTTAGHSHSPSTRGHINGILSRLGSEKLSVKKGQLHHGKNPVDHDAWIKVKKSTVSEESIDEAAYSAKAARKGKDIGKPGKMFAQIAAKAGERYGSAERGKKVAGAILAKIRAKHMKEEQIDEVIQKSQMRPGETLGQTMNRLAGKTAIKGGANDPSSPNFRGPKPSATKEIGDKGYSSDGGRTVSLKPTADSGTAQAAPAPTPAPRPASIPGQKSPAPVNQADTIKQSGGEAPMAAPKVAPLPPSRPANLGGSSASAKPMQNPDQNITKVMKESVQVGENKYRIV